MTTGGQNQRRIFLKVAVAGLGVFALWLMDKLATRATALPEYSSRTITVPLAIGECVRFFDDAIVVRNKSGALAVFSSACTHLGCRLNRTEANEIVCPCHGSRFDLNGRVARGPATRSLAPLTFEVDSAASLLHITLT